MYEFSKVAGYKISIQKSVAFPYTNHEISQRELKKKKNSFKVCQKKKILGINLTKEMKTCMLKTIKDWYRKLKMIQKMESYPTVPTIGLEVLTLLRWPYHPKQSTDLM